MNQSHRFTSLLAFFLALCSSLSACGAREPGAPVTVKSSSATPSPRSTPRPEPEAAETDSDESKAEDVDENEEDSDAGYFHGHRCTVDCSGHEAGYRWAEEHEIHDPDDCGGKSQSFIEGCQAWAEDNP